jgi:hypothetical protein
MSPPWLSAHGSNGERFGYVFGLMSDVLLEKAFQAMTIRVPGAGDPSQLPWLANDRLLVQGPAESDHAFAKRLQGAFAAWKKAGSRLATLGQLQAYLQNLQPGVAASLPEMTIVGGNGTYSTWDTIYQGTPLGAPPAHAPITPANWNWDGKYQPWRSWLILYMSSLPTGQSGTGATSLAPAAAGVQGQLTAGVWVPGTSGPAINPGSVVISGLAGLTSSNAGQYMTITGGTHSYSDVTLAQILQVISPTSCAIANPNAPGASSDSGLSWSISYYPYIAPGPVWGTPGVTYGQGELVTPPIDTGSNIGGVWQPSTVSGPTTETSISCGLSCSPQVIVSIRQILQRRKQAGAYYPDIIICFDGSTGSAGSAYSPNSVQGSGNPDGTFGGRGKLSNGVWVPNRLVTSACDCFCQGTGSWSNCSVPNIT